MMSSLRTWTLFMAMAPIASSLWPGAPSLRTRQMSMGMCKCFWISSAMGRPPLGRARIIALGELV